MSTFSVVVERAYQSVHCLEHTLEFIGSFIGIKSVKYSNEDKLKMRLQQPMTIL